MISKVFPLFSDDTVYSNDALNHTHFQIASEAIVKLFKKLSLRKKVLLIFDDLHWMDEMSQSLLFNILVHCKEENIMLLGAYRDDFEKQLSSLTIPLVKSDLVHIIHLQRFSYDEIKKITYIY